MRPRRSRHSRSITLHRILLSGMAQNVVLINASHVHGMEFVVLLDRIFNQEFDIFSLNQVLVPRLLTIGRSIQLLPHGRHRNTQRGKMDKNILVLLRTVQDMDESKALLFVEPFDITNGTVGNAG